MEKTCPKRILETERLVLREMEPDDYDALYAVLADSENMKHYPYAFDEARVRDWIARNRKRYIEDGFGLWAVCLKETGEIIGDCLTALSVQVVCGLVDERVDAVRCEKVGEHQFCPFSA